MSGSDQETTERTPFLWILGTFAAGLFFLTIIGGLILGYLLWRPRSTLANLLISILQVGQDAPTDVGIKSVIDLLIGAIGASGSLSLSLALAAIYLSQNRILNRQSEIQRTQTTIMRRQNVPVVTPHESGVKLHAGRPSLEKVTDGGEVMTSTDGNGPYVSVAVENHGNEIAEQVQLGCLVDVASIEDPEIYTGVTELTVDGMHTKPPQGEGALIPPSRGLSLLRGKPMLSRDSEDVTKRKMFVAGIADQLQNLNHADKDVDLQSESIAVRFGFVLIFTNSVNERFQVPLDQAFSVTTAHFEEQEPDDVTITDLRDAANEYSIDDLMEDVDWSIPEEAFKDR